MCIILILGLIYNVLISYYAYKLDGGGYFTLRPLIVLFSLTFIGGIFMNTLFVLFHKID